MFQCNPLAEIRAVGQSSNEGEKGKPLARVGRKATGLFEPAGLPPQNWSNFSLWFAEVDHRLSCVHVVNAWARLFLPGEEKV